MLVIDECASSAASPPPQYYENSRALQGVPSRAPTPRAIHSGTRPRPASSPSTPIPNVPLRQPMPAHPSTRTPLVPQRLSDIPGSSLPGPGGRGPLRSEEQNRQHRRTSSHSVWYVCAHRRLSQRGMLSLRRLQHLLQLYPSAQWQIPTSRRPPRRRFNNAHTRRRRCGPQPRRCCTRRLKFGPGITTRTSVRVSYVEHDGIHSPRCFVTSVGEFYQPAPTPSPPTPRSISRHPHAYYPDPAQNGSQIMYNQQHGRAYAHCIRGHARTDNSLSGLQYGKPMRRNTPTHASPPLCRCPNHAHTFRSPCQTRKLCSSPIPMRRWGTTTNKGVSGLPPCPHDETGLLTDPALRTPYDSSTRTLANQCSPDAQGATTSGRRSTASAVSSPPSCASRSVCSRCCEYSLAPVLKIASGITEVFPIQVRLREEV